MSVEFEILSHSPEKPPFNQITEDLNSLYWSVLAMNYEAILTRRTSMLCAFLTMCVMLADTHKSHAVLTTIVDFEFNEAAGTVLADDPADGVNASVTDSVGGYSWALHDASGGGDQELQDIVTTGSGFLDPSGYDNGDRGDGSIALNALDQINLMQNQRVRLTAEINSWNFGAFDSSDQEEFRIGLGNTSATSTVAAIELERDGENIISIRGFSGGDDGTSQDIFDDIQSESVKLILDVNLLTETYSVLTQVGAGPETPLTGNTNLSIDVADDNINFLRIGFDEDFNGDTFNVDRYTLQVMTVPEPSSFLFLLGVSTVTLCSRSKLKRSE